MVAAVVGDIHSYSLPRITCSQLAFFPLHRCRVNRLTRLSPFHYHPNIRFVYSGIDHSSEVERPFDSRMSILSVNADYLLRIQSVCDSGTRLFIFVSASHQTGLDTRSMTRRSKQHTVVTEARILSEHWLATVAKPESVNLLYPWPI